MRIEKLQFLTPLPHRRFDVVIYRIGIIQGGVEPHPVLAVLFE
jgi:hypothetical protein